MTGTRPDLATVENERRWSAGAWAAAVFALFLFVFNIGMALYSTTRPTDGWSVTGDITADEPEITFDFPLTQNSTSIQPGDRLVAVNGQTDALSAVAGDDIYEAGTLGMAFRAGYDSNPTRSQIFANDDHLRRCDR